MNRSLLIGISATIALFSGIAIYFYFNNIKVKNKSATEAIPNDAFIIIQSEDMLASWADFAATALWSDLQNNPNIKSFAESIDNLSSLIDGNDNLKDLLSDNNTTLSLHNDNNTLSLLTVIESGRSDVSEEIARYIAEKKGGKVHKRSFERIPVFDVNDATGNTIISITCKDQLLICSHNSTLVEESIRKLKYQLPNSTKGFEQVQLLAETNVDANIFINYQKLPLLFNVFTKTEYQNLFGYLNGFANWSMLNVQLNKDQIGLSGITFTDDSVFQFLDLFKNQTPKPLQLQQFMPKNTSFALQMGFSDYIKFNAELTEYLIIHQKSEAYARFTDSLENRYDIDISQKILAYIDGEASLVMTEPSGSNYLQNLAAFIRFKDPTAMGLALKECVKAMDKKGEADSVSFFHEGLEIERIKLDNFLKIYYGELMENIHSPYYTQLNDVFVFANDVNTLKYIIEQYKSGSTLANDERYKSYEPTLARNNNVSVFISPSKNFLLPNGIITDTFFSVLNTNQAEFKKFEFFNIQFANTNNKAFYTQVQYKFNTLSTNETQFMWAAKLDTTFNVAPQVVYNSELRQQVIFVQDVNNTLYCLSNSGSLIWRSKLNGKLIGNFIPLDVQQNGHICYLFSTDKQANLIDEKGVSLYNFPVRYPGKAICSPTLTDFYKDSTFQFFVPLENNRVVAYSINGKPISGWMPKVLDAKAAAPIDYFKQGQYHYVYTTDALGNLCLFDNKGKNLKPKMEIKAIRFLHIDQPDTINAHFLAIDSVGKVWEITLDSNYRQANQTLRHETEPLSKVTISADPVTQNRFYLFNQTKGWALFNNTFQKIKGEQFADSIPHYVQFGADVQGRIMLNNYRISEGKYYWFDMNGKLYTDFPLNGNTPFSTANLMLDRTNYLIGGDKQNNIFAYKLK